jgi:hypothetical protein
MVNILISSSGSLRSKHTPSSNAPHWRRPRLRWQPRWVQLAYDARRRLWQSVVKSSTGDKISRRARAPQELKMASSKPSPRQEQPRESFTQNWTLGIFQWHIFFANHLTSLIVDWMAGQMTSSERPLYVNTPVSLPQIDGQCIEICFLH